MTRCLKFLQHADKAVLVDFGQLGQVIVREHVGKLGLLSGGHVLEMAHHTHDAFGFRPDGAIQARE